MVDSRSQREKGQKKSGTAPVVFRVPILGGGGVKFQPVLFPGRTQCPRTRKTKNKKKKSWRFWMMNERWNRCGTGMHNSGTARLPRLGRLPRNAPQDHAQKALRVCRTVHCVHCAGMTGMTGGGERMPGAGQSRRAGACRRAGTATRPLQPAVWLADQLAQRDGEGWGRIRVWAHSTDISCCCDGPSTRPKKDAASKQNCGLRFRDGNLRSSVVFDGTKSKSAAI